MKKIWMVPVVVVAMGLAGCGHDASNQPSGDSATTETEQNQIQMTEPSGISEWMTGLAAGKGYECEYAVPMTESEGGTATILMQDDRYRSEVETAEGTFISVFDGETSYSWVAGETEGVKMSHECMEDFGGDMAESEEEEETMEETFRTPEEALEMIPDISCRETSSPNFAIPGDVEFVDQCEALQAQMQVLEQYQDQLPADVVQMMEGMEQ